jgi:hypothetical protein
VIGRKSLLQLRVLSFGLLQNGDVGIGVFPEGEEIFVGGFRLGGIARHRIGATDLKMRECSDEFVYYNPTMVEDFLELGSGCTADHINDHCSRDGGDWSCPPPKPLQFEDTITGRTQVIDNEIGGLGLPDDVLEKVYHRNAEALFARLKSSEQSSERRAEQGAGRGISGETTAGMEAAK